MHSLEGAYSNVANAEQLDKVTEEVALALETLDALKNDIAATYATKAELDSINAKFDGLNVLDQKVWDLRKDAYGEINGLKESVAGINNQIADLGKRSTDIEVTTKLLGQSLAKHATSLNSVTERLGVVENMANALTGNVFKVKMDVAKLPTKADVADGISALRAEINAEIAGIDYVSPEQMDSKVTMVYTKVLMLQDMVQKNQESNVAKFSAVDELANITFDQIDANIARIDANEKAIASLTADVATKADAEAVEVLNGKMTDMTVTSKMLSQSIMNINKKIAGLNYVTPEQLSERMSVLYKMIAVNSSDIAKLEAGLKENENMIYTAFDQLDANIARMDGLDKKIGNLEAELVNYATKEDFDLAMSITNSLTKDMFLVNRNKLDKTEFKAYQATMDDQLAEVNSKLDDMAVAQVKFQKSTNVALVASFVAVAFSVVSLILK